MEMAVRRARESFTTAIMRDAVQQFVKSEYDKEEFRARRLTVSQAYCLLWQDTETGEISGRQTSTELLGGATAACILDLVILGKVAIEVRVGSTLGIKTEDVLVKVLQDSPTGTYLDRAIFDRILERHHRYSTQPGKLRDWILQDLRQLIPKNRCATVTLDGLADMMILDRIETFFTITYPTLNAAPKQAIIQDIRQIGLHGGRADSYLRALLTILRAQDYLDLSLNTYSLMRRCFTEEQYTRAKEHIKAAVLHGNQGDKGVELGVLESSTGNA